MRMRVFSLFHLRYFELEDLGKCGIGSGDLGPGLKVLCLCRVLIIYFTEVSEPTWRISSPPPTSSA